VTSGTTCQDCPWPITVTDSCPGRDHPPLCRLRLVRPSIQTQLASGLLTPGAEPPLQTDVQDPTKVELQSGGASPKEARRTITPRNPGPTPEERTEAALAFVRQCLWRGSWTGIQPCKCWFVCHARLGPPDAFGGRETTEAHCLTCIERNTRRRILPGSRDPFSGNIP
jgi:hypothetical protein